MPGFTRILCVLFGAVVFWSLEALCPAAERNQRSWWLKKTKQNKNKSSYVIELLPFQEIQTKNYSFDATWCCRFDWFHVAMTTDVMACTWQRRPRKETSESSDCLVFIDLFIEVVHIGFKWIRRHAIDRLRRVTKTREFNRWCIRVFNPPILIACHYCTAGKLYIFSRLYSGNGTDWTKQTKINTIVGSDNIRNKSRPLCK